ncbi:hypothetical protein B0A50_01247 [Salinomyces thailandicus]|uniref:BTB domain-containing protein n=1 Tax=Salinomyces thailandicus TaxID=706561 RepID=A0A4U0UB97_9PEZI|nr:hypothetical protein B0A50_01247 [Salinomyces thailandica]
MSGPFFGSREFDEMDSTSDPWPSTPRARSRSPLRLHDGHDTDRPPAFSFQFTQVPRGFREDDRSIYGDATPSSFSTKFRERREQPSFVLGRDYYDPPQVAKWQDDTLQEDSFLELYPAGDGTLSYPDGDGELASISNINVDLIEARCPLLSMAFDQSRTGRPHLHLETLTAMSALPFLRYLYTESYALASSAGDFYEDVPTSVLLHCELYRLGDIYDLPELKTQAYVNILRQCEFGCSSPDKPIHLCSAIRFSYQHLSSHENIIESILSYCITCFNSHRLGGDSEFRQLAYELRPFHQKLCWMASNRGGEDAEAASAIIQLPYRLYKPDTYASMEGAKNSRLADVVYHFHAEDKTDRLGKGRKTRGEPVEVPSRLSNLTLALRPRSTTPSPVPTLREKESSASEDEGFYVVKREDSSPLVESAAPGAASDFEYEVLSALESVRGMVINDNEGCAEAPMNSTSRAFPMQARRTAPPTDSDTDSEWSVI